MEEAQGSPPPPPHPPSPLPRRRLLASACFPGAGHTLTTGPRSFTCCSSLGLTYLFSSITLSIQKMSVIPWSEKMRTFRWSCSPRSCKGTEAVRTAPRRKVL